MDRIHILATGTSRGIGAAIAARLDLPDVRLIGHSSRPGDGERIPADLDEPGAARALWAEALERLDGRIDVLVNNAGIFEAAPIDLPDDDWLAAVGTHDARSTSPRRPSSAGWRCSISPPARAAAASSTSRAAPPIAATRPRTGTMPPPRAGWSR